MTREKTKFLAQQLLKEGHGLEIQKYKTDEITNLINLILTYQFSKEGGN